MNSFLNLFLWSQVFHFYRPGRSAWGLVSCSMQGWQSTFVLLSFAPPPQRRKIMQACAVRKCFSPEYGLLVCILKGWQGTYDLFCCPATPMSTGMWVPLFIQCVLTENINMSPGSLLEGGVLGRARSLPHYSSLTPVFPWLCGLSSSWWGWRGLGRQRDGKALPYCLLVALPPQCMTSEVDS